MREKSWSEIVEDYKILLVVIIVGFFILEIGIWAAASMGSGKQSWIQVMDEKDQVIYEVKGSTLTNFNKYYFENTFGSLEQYQVKLLSKETPFPFRAWLSAAVGLPVGLVLLLTFVLKAATALIQGRNLSAEPAAEPSAAPENKAERLLFKLSSLNVFIIGFLLICAVLLYWIIPNMLTFLGRAGIETFENYKYFFMAVVAVLFLLFAGFMYMRYQLARKSMDAQTEIRKFEIQLEHERRLNGVPALGYGGGERPQLIEYDDVEAMEDKGEGGQT